MQRDSRETAKGTVFIRGGFWYNTDMPMTMDINAVKEQMHIKDNSGYAFLDTIVQSAGMSADVDRAWALEIDRRRADYQAGRIQLVEGEEVFRKAMSKYA